MSSCPPPFEDALRGERKKRAGAFTCHGTTARTNAEGRGDVSAGVPPADGSIGRQLKTSASALGRAGARPAKVTRGGSAEKRLFRRGVQTGCCVFEGDRGGCLAACASSPHSQLRTHDETDGRDRTISEQPSGGDAILILIANTALRGSTQCFPCHHHAPVSNTKRTCDTQGSDAVTHRGTS